jgi:hypothetical protein
LKSRRGLLSGVVASASWLACAFAAFSVNADPLLPAPTDSGIDQTIADLAAGFQRQQDVFATAENGLSLDTTFDPAAVPTVRAFFAQTASDDFQQVTGQHPFTVVSTFGEWSDEGNFGGVASVGVAARLMVLRRDGASASDLAAARAAAVRAAQAWHVYATIGGPGVIARGVRRVAPEDPTDPPLPGTLPPTVPLADDAGNPLPAVKDNTWRAPVAASDGGWIWQDDTSKDQVIGYAMASAWLYDALLNDPEVPPQVLSDLSADLVAFAAALRVVAPETGLDLSLRDADGRQTTYHDLNPRELVPGVVVPADTPQNGFNATLALSIIRAAYHVSGDLDAGSYYYDDLVGTRRFPQISTSLIDQVVFQGPTTDFSNVNMLAIAYATLERVETDPTVRAELQTALETAYWNTGDSRDCSHDLQPWFDVVYASFSTSADAGALADRIRAQLSGFQPAPAIERTIVNCDAGELAAGQCLAVDGMTVIHLEPTPDSYGSRVATVSLPTSVRPDSDFEWRSDPFAVNGQGSTLMDPRGDYLAAYWMARLVDRDSSNNISPNARPWPPVTVAVPMGCHCSAAPSLDVWLLLGVVWTTVVRRRRAGELGLSSDAAREEDPQLVGFGGPGDSRVGGGNDGHRIHPRRSLPGV